MSAIISSVSSVGAYLKETVNQYSQIMNIAQAVLSSMEQMVVFVAGEKEKLEKQIIILAQLDETLVGKTKKLIEKVELTQAERDRYSEQYYRAQSGDEIAFARYRLETARKQYDSLTESYETARQLQKEVSQRRTESQQLFRAFSIMIDALHKNSLEVKKILSTLADEINYNTQSLSATLSSLEGYLAVTPIVTFGVSAMHEKLNGAAISSNGSLNRTSSTRNKKVYKLKNGSLGYDSEGNRPLYRFYFTQAQPVKGILYDLMKGVRHDLRQAVLDQLKGVVFLSARHGFNYRFNRGGKVIRIIGIDVTDPSYNHHLLMHVGHYLYEIDKSKEKLDMENRISLEIAENLKSADSNIRKMASDFTPVKSGKSIDKNGRISFKSSGSKFFAQCFRAYVAEDYDFLNAVKSNFGESYNAFMEIILRLPDR